MAEMKSPMHPGEVVELNLEELGISISEAARGLGITRQQLHKVLAGTSAVTPEMAVKLEGRARQHRRNLAPHAGQLRPVQSAREKRRREREAI